jgi:hypothetical protein
MNDGKTQMNDEERTGKMDLLIKQHSQKVKYNDTHFRFLLPLPAAHYSLAINEPEPFLEFIQLPNYPLLLFQAWLLVFILVNIIYYTTSYLDRKFPWHKVKVKRLVLQVGIGVVFPSFLSLFLAFAFFKINGVDIFETNYLKLERWFSILFILIVNCYYIIYYFVSLLAGLKKKEKTVAKAKINDLVFSQGSRIVKLAEKDIAVFFHKNGFSFAHTFEGAQYLVEQPLSEIILAVNSFQFFRVSRSIIVNRDTISSFTPASSGRLHLFLNSMENKEVYVSQRNTKEFKSWNKINLD